MNLLEKAKNCISGKVTNMGEPEATITDVYFKGSGLYGINLDAKVNVKNPYSVSIPIREIGYSFKSVDRVVASGTIPRPGSLKGNCDTMFDVTINLPQSALLRLVKDIGGDQDVDYVLGLGLVLIDLPEIGSFNVPVQYKGMFMLPSVSDLYFGQSELKAETPLADTNAKVVEKDGE